MGRYGTAAWKEGRKEIGSEIFRKPGGHEQERRKKVSIARYFFCAHVRDTTPVSGEGDPDTIGGHNVGIGEDAVNCAEIDAGQVFFIAGDRHQLLDTTLLNHLVVIHIAIRSKKKKEAWELSWVEEEEGEDSKIRCLVSYML